MGLEPMLSCMNEPWWRIEGTPTPDEWMALFTCLTLVAAVVAAGIALSQLRAHFATERARSRPYVFVDFAFKSTLMQIEIKNIGATAASDVRLRVNPPFESGLRKQAERLNAVFSEPEKISMLAPGRRMLYTFDSAPDYYENNRQTQYTVTAIYTDMPKLYRRPWKKLWRREEVEYTDTYVLDFGQWSQASTETDYDNKNWNIASRQEKRTKDALQILGQISASLRRQEIVPIIEQAALDVVQQIEIIAQAAIEHPVDGLERRSQITDSDSEDEGDASCGLQ